MKGVKGDQRASFNFVCCLENCAIVIMLHNKFQLTAFLWIGKPGYQTLFASLVLRGREGGGRGGAGYEADPFHEKINVRSLTHL